VAPLRVFEARDMAEPHLIDLKRPPRTSTLEFARRRNDAAPCHKETAFAVFGVGLEGDELHPFAKIGILPELGPSRTRVRDAKEVAEKPVEGTGDSLDHGSTAWLVFDGEPYALSRQTKCSLRGSQIHTPSTGGQFWPLGRVGEIQNATS
jgi:hypothetical protein